MIPNYWSFIPAAFIVYNEKIKRKKKKYFFNFLNLFLFGPAAAGGVVWWLVLVVVYIAVAIAPITAINKQYIRIGNINISISSTLAPLVSVFLL